MDTLETVRSWIEARRVTEVECLVPDMSGIARGKILPANKFLRGIADNTLCLPESLFMQTVTGEYPWDDDVTSEADQDIYLQPDASTIRIVPWNAEPTAQVICDSAYIDGKPVDFAARQVLRRVLALYDEQGWKPVVAPELEFFLVKVNTDPDYPLEPPVGRSGRPETAPQSYGIDAVNEFDPLFEQVYAYCEAQNIDIDTLSHEAGAAQMEINFNHGDALELADEAFVFKRTLRQVALQHKVYATFMAKPMHNQPGSAMHIHQSVVDKNTGRNLFATEGGKDTVLFRRFIGGLQKYLPSVMPMLAPNVNLYRRLALYSSAPINVHWAVDNRTVGLRVPRSSPSARRVENRVAGADANPYLAIAATLACGYLGMIEKVTPRAPITGSGYDRAFTLPRHLPEALNKFASTKSMRNVLGERFVDAVYTVKNTEWNRYQQVISSWEREFLLLNV